jgi:hypothetical protein
VNDDLLTNTILRSNQLLKENAVLQRQVAQLQSQVLHQWGGSEVTPEQHRREMIHTRAMENSNSQLFAQHVTDVQENNALKTQVNVYKDAYSAAVKSIVQNVQARGALGAVSKALMTLIQDMTETLKNINPRGRPFASATVTQWMQLIDNDQRQCLEFDPAQLAFTDLLRSYLEIYERVMVKGTATRYEKDLFVSMEGYAGQGHPSTDLNSFTPESAITYCSQNIRVGRTWIDNACAQLFQIVKDNNS